MKTFPIVELPEVEDRNESRKRIAGVMDWIVWGNREPYTFDHHDCHASPEDGCTHPSHIQI